MIKRKDSIAKFKLFKQNNTLLKINFSRFKKNIRCFNIRLHKAEYSISGMNWNRDMMKSLIIDQ